jgi:hypothetical protein
MAVFEHSEATEKPELHARPERASRPRLMYVLGLAPQKIGGI